MIGIIEKSKDIKLIKFRHDVLVDSESLERLDLEEVSKPEDILHDVDVNVGTDFT